MSNHNDVILFFQELTYPAPNPRATVLPGSRLPSAQARGITGDPRYLKTEKHQARKKYVHYKANPISPPERGQSLRAARMEG